MSFGKLGRDFFHTVWPMFPKFCQHANMCWTWCRHFQLRESHISLSIVIPLFTWCCHINVVLLECIQVMMFKQWYDYLTLVQPGNQASFFKTCAKSGEIYNCHSIHSHWVQFWGSIWLYGSWLVHSVDTTYNVISLTPTGVELLKLFAVSIKNVKCIRIFLTLSFWCHMTQVHSWW